MFRRFVHSTDSKLTVVAFRIVDKHGQMMFPVVRKKQNMGDILCKIDDKINNSDEYAEHGFIHELQLFSNENKRAMFFLELFIKFISEVIQSWKVRSKVLF